VRRRLVLAAYASPNASSLTKEEDACLTADRTSPDNIDGRTSPDNPPMILDFMDRGTRIEPCDPVDGFVP
jgi:hypothetical protein